MATPTTTPTAAPVAAPTAPVAPQFVPGPSTPTAKSDTGAAPAVAIPAVQPLTRPVPLTKAPTPAPKGLPAGWWRVQSVKGLKSDVAKAVQSNADIPAHWQSALQAEIAKHTATAVTVDAHFHSVKGKQLIYVDISPIDGFVTPS